MVKVSIHIESPNVDNQSKNINDINLYDSTIDFTRAFSLLFNQNDNKTEIGIIPLGSIFNAQNKLKEIIKSHSKDVLLIVLDAPKSRKEERLKNNYSIAPDKVFFMIQKMESWILSQPEVIENYCNESNFIRKKDGERIEFDIKAEEINHPEQKLNSLFMKYFIDRNGKKAKYHKTKVAPKLIEKLSLSKLIEDFDEVENLMKTFKK